MANYEQTKYDFDGANLTGVQGVNTGIVVPWGDSVIPSGFLECNGSAVSRATYAALFAVVGTTYGAGDGSTTFSLPDLQNETPIGRSGTKAIASTGGADTVAGTGNVAGSLANATLSTAQLASHSHGYHSRQTDTLPQSQEGQLTNGSGNSLNSGMNSAGSASGHAHNLSATFSGDANSVLQPYLTLLYIIKT